MVMERERRALSSVLLVAMLGTYVAFLATIYGSEARDKYDEVPVITYLEQYQVATSKAYMLALGILGWAAFLSSADVYYRFVDNPPLFVVASACLVVGLLAIVMQAYTLSPRGEPRDPDRVFQHQAWTATFAACFLAAMSVYARRSWQTKHLPYTRASLLASSALGGIVYVLSYSIRIRIGIRSFEYRSEGALTAAAVGQNVLIMSSLLFYVSTVRELWPSRETERASLLRGP